MIRSEQYHQALHALQRLIVYAKDKAYRAGETQIAELLNDIEMLPEYISDEEDRSGEFAEMLSGIARIDSSCGYIVEEFERTLTPSAP
jgi:hypothetical protein